MLLVACLGLFAGQTPYPWGGLWVGVPAALAVSLLVSWRFGARGLLIPIVLGLAAFALVGPRSLWVWWIPVAAITGAWMGMREEGGGIASGQRAGTLLPLLLLAAALPLMPGFSGLIARLSAETDRAMQEAGPLMKSFQKLGLVSAEDFTPAEIVRRRDALQSTLPSMLFLWVVALVAAGRALAARMAATLRWPRLSRAPLRDWRLPDGAVWVFLLGLGLLVAQASAFAPSAWTLLINTGLAYCVQGIAVVESLLLARGVPPSIIVLTMLFVFTIAMPVFLLTTAAVGLSDVWLDYRRLDPSPDRHQT